MVLIFSGDLGSARYTYGFLQWLLSGFSLGPDQLLTIHAYFRKTGHVMAYGGLYFLWFRAFQRNLGYDLRKSFLWSMGLCLLVSLGDEGHQAFYHSRTGSIRDVGLDASAALLVALFTAIFWRPGPRRTGD